MSSCRRGQCALVVLLTTLWLGGCATVPGGDPRDPWEPFNRGVSRFNDSVDDHVLRPVARGYESVVPDPIRQGVNNFFGNLSDIWSTVNHALQLKPREMAESAARVGINSTVGVLGLVDVATALKIERRREDFGQTLGRWGVATGPYLVLPLLGPSTLRDALVLPVDAQGDLVNALEARAQTPLTVLRIVDTRAGLLKATGMLESVALDRYTFVRDAHLQRRRGVAAPASAGDPEERYDLPETPPEPGRPSQLTN